MSRSTTTTSDHEPARSQKSAAKRGRRRRLLRRMCDWRFVCRWCERSSFRETRVGSVSFGCVLTAHAAVVSSFSARSRSITSTLVDGDSGSAECQRDARANATRAGDAVVRSIRRIGLSVGDAEFGRDHRRSHVPRGNTHRRFGVANLQNRRRKSAHDFDRHQSLGEVWPNVRFVELGRRSGLAEPHHAHGSERDVGQPRVWSSSSRRRRRTSWRWRSSRRWSPRRRFSSRQRISSIRWRFFSAMGRMVAFLLGRLRDRKRIVFVDADRCTRKDSKGPQRSSVASASERNELAISSRRRQLVG